MPSKLPNDRTPETLDDLHSVLTSCRACLTNIDPMDEQDGDHTCGGLDWCYLPTYGGAEPSDTSEIWSWDETRLLVGTCASDLRIVARDENELPSPEALTEVEEQSLGYFNRYIAGDR